MLPPLDTTTIPSPVMDVGDVADLLGCSCDHVYAMERAGRIPQSARLGSLRRWSRTAIFCWVDAGMPSQADRSRQHGVGND